LLNAANTFDFPELRKACWDFALTRTSAEDLRDLVSSSKIYSHYKLTRTLMQRVSSAK
jgi:hypothetical protein